ncbi:MAG: hypothetical protein HYX95_01525 [Chloroflexi bacterium]|nr:hypothetical protein [Chloroflexota bacterium]
MRKILKMTPDIWRELEVLRRGSLGEQPQRIDRELVAVQNEAPEEILTLGFVAHS